MKGSIIMFGSGRAWRGFAAWAAVSLFLVFIVSPWAGLRTPRGGAAGPVSVVIPPETPFREVARRIRDAGLLGNGVPFVLAARIAGIDRKVRWGTYELSPAMSPWEILGALGQGRILEVQVTVPEGTDLFELAAVLAAAGVVPEAEFLEAARNPDTLGTLEIPGSSAEGYCFPDTYRFPVGTPAGYVLRGMVRRFRERIGPLLAAGEPPEGLSSAEEVLVLASIVEREARVPAERGLIAGVYLNRLRRGMRLEADPTAVYGLKRRGERITPEDIRAKTPYNTYHIRGLPPGPIANPGEDAVRAVLYPGATKALYFVARGDGTHEFSRTFRAHQKAVRALGRERGK